MVKRQQLANLEVFEQVRHILSLVPSEESLDGVIAAFKKVAEFLEEYARVLKMLPTQEQIREKQIPQALDRITDYMKTLSEVSRMGGSRRKVQPRTKADLNLETIIAELATVPNEQLEEKLSEFGLTVAMLKEILERLGASARGAWKKEDIIRRVANELRARRTLSGLRDGAAP